MIKYNSLLERLELNSTIDPITGCYIWNLSKVGGRPGMGGQYGKIKVKGIQTTVHRVSAKMHLSDYSDDLMVLHRCDNPPCWNPNHLFMGTNSDNIKDAFAKGRVLNKWKGFLTEEEIKDLLGLYDLGWSQVKIANYFGYDPSGIHRILKREGRL